MNATKKFIETSDKKRFVTKSLWVINYWKWWWIIMDMYKYWFLWFLIINKSNFLRIENLKILFD